MLLLFFLFSFFFFFSLFCRPPQNAPGVNRPSAPLGTPLRVTETLLEFSARVSFKLGVLAYSQKQQVTCFPAVSKEGYADYYFVA